ncbi:MAG: hypothetical protein KH051_01170 [Actinomyces sp.]|nr:hypothetical protein [Actinomyces sp.]
MGDQDERVGMDRGHASRGSLIPSARVHDEGRVKGSTGGHHPRVVRAGPAARIPDEGPHAPDDGQVLAQRGQIRVFGSVEIRPPHAGNVVVTRERDTGHGPGRVDNDRLARPRSAGTACPAPHTPSDTPTTPALACQQPHNAGDPNPSGDPGDHPHRTRSARAGGCLGDEGHEERTIPGQPHLTTLPNTHAGHSLGHWSRRRCQDQRGLARVRAHARPREHRGIARAVEVGRGEADECNGSSRWGDVGVHKTTMRPHRLSRPPACAPLWTTRTRGATLCIEGSDGGPLWIEPTLE